MAQKQILIVEDEQEIQELIRYNLVKEGYREDVVRSRKLVFVGLILCVLVLFPGVIKVSEMQISAQGGEGG